MAGAPSVFPAACLRALTRAGLGFVFSLVVFAATLWVTALAVSAHGPEEGLISAPDVCGPGGFVIPVRTAGPPLCTAGPTSPPDFPSPPALRLQAAFLDRALELPAANNVFADTADHPFRHEIARLAAAGITRGCDPPANTRFCPGEPVTRAEMAVFLVRAGLVDVG